MQSWLVDGTADGIIGSGLLTALILPVFMVIYTIPESIFDTVAAMVIEPLSFLPLITDSGDSHIRWGIVNCRVPTWSG